MLLVEFEGQQGCPVHVVLELVAGVADIASMDDHLADQLCYMVSYLTIRLSVFLQSHVLEFLAPVAHKFDGGIALLFEVFEAGEMQRHIGGQDVFHDDLAGLRFQGCVFEVEDIGLRALVKETEQKGDMHVLEDSMVTVYLRVLRPLLNIIHIVLPLMVQIMRYARNQRKEELLRIDILLDLRRQRKRLMSHLHNTPLTKNTEKACEKL